jgi:hypothetical protein
MWGGGQRAEGRGSESQSFTTRSVFEAGRQQLRKPVSRQVLVRWAHDSGSRACAVPRRWPRGGRQLFGREATTRRPSDPIVGRFFSFQGAIWATRTTTFVQMRACRTRRSAGNRNLSAADLEAARLPVPRPCCAVVCTAFAPEIKRAAPLRKRLERSWTRESPFQIVEHAP